MAGKSLTSPDLELETLGAVLEELLDVLWFRGDAEVVEVPQLTGLMELEDRFAPVVGLFDEVQADVDHLLQELLRRLI